MKNDNIHTLTLEAVSLLQDLIRTPRTSREEHKAASILEQWVQAKGLEYKRIGNNIIVFPDNFDASVPVVMLNAHIDTVRPVASWQRNPYEPTLEADTLYGIGSNDCGGGLVALLQAFRTCGRRDVVFVASCEEEVSGEGGIRMVIEHWDELLPGVKVDVAVVGEPTGLQPAVAERGLMVIDMTAHGKAGHAARQEGVNAIYEALGDMQWIHDYEFPKVSSLLGPTRMNLTMINSGTQHNVVPDECRMVIDVRTNELYSNEEVFRFIDENTRSECKARSFRLGSSCLPEQHPYYQRLISLGLVPFGSPTLSDQALMPWPSFKLGPGESSRSHSADEYIRISEIEAAIKLYVDLLETTK